jgi:hypothetical protein
MVFFRSKNCIDRTCRPDSLGCADLFPLFCLAFVGLDYGEHGLRASFDE